MSMFKRVLAVLLALLLCITVLGCNKYNADTPEQSPSPTVEITETPAPTEFVTPVPTEPPVDKDAINAEFEMLDLDLFVEIVTSSGDAYNQFISAEPQQFGIDPANVERGWGDYYTLESHQETIEQFVQIADRLRAIDREHLTSANQVAYDSLLRFCEFTIGYKDYYYYDEPLTPVNGLHSSLPISMICYKIRTAEDLEWYVYLLEDMPRIIAQIEQYEVDKADNGLFMTEVALDQVIESCRSFAELGDECFLIDYFDELLEKAYSFGLSEEEGQALKQRNDSAVLDGILPAYVELAQTLESLRDDCSDFVGAAARGYLQKEFFIYDMRNEAGTMASIDEILFLLENMGDSIYYKMVAAIINDPDALDRYGEAITFGSTEADMEWLEQYTATFYPNVPEYEVEYIQIPDAVASDFSPAAYLTPSFDEYHHNIILLNPTSADTSALSTLAHEGVPGHMYQFLYFRNMGELALTQQLLAPTGYAEAWTVFTEYLLSQNCEEFGGDYYTIIECESIFANIFLPAYISIQVNYNGWTAEQVEAFLAQYGIGDFAEIMFEYAVTMPVYAMSYAIGFSYMYDIYASKRLSDPASYKAFFEDLLSFGPTYLDILVDLLEE